MEICYAFMGAGIRSHILVRMIQSVLTRILCHPPQPMRHVPDDVLQLLPFLYMGRLVSVWSGASWRPCVPHHPLQRPYQLAQAKPRHNTSEHIFINCQW
jgi:hypothetical protein